MNNKKPRFVYMMSLYKETCFETEQKRKRKKGQKESNVDGIIYPFVHTHTHTHTHTRTQHIIAMVFIDRHKNYNINV